MAATDPDRAERIANSIYGSVKARALTSVATAVSDPSRAARLVDDAERVGNSITDKSEKAIALSAITKALAA